MTEFNNLLATVNHINKIIESKAFTPSLVHTRLFAKVNLLLRQSCGYPTSEQIQVLQNKLSEHLKKPSLNSNKNLSQLLKKLIEIAPMATCSELDSLILEIETETEALCKNFIYKIIDSGQLFILTSKETTYA